MTKETFRLLTSKDNEILQVFVPCNSEDRPDYIMDRNSTSCPYERIRTSLIMEIDRKTSIREIKNNGYDFCWNSCDVTSCPTYIKERGEQ